ncbi:MAG TPA: glycoside hydrolase domain-containing protein [Bryobacteraceae bacterium]|nr:glycoside hydrolase domain-containing protein [Bryobacteraceae bacterium]
MKLLSPNTGWVADGNRLYWTTDGGDHWTDITPIPPDAAHATITLRIPFFRNTSEGWAIISYPEQIAPSEIVPNATTVYTIAHTVDSGASWSFTPLTYPELPQWIQDTFAGPADLYFVDSLHGWLDIAFEGLSKPGKLLATEDGGKTWNWVNSPGFSGPITFASLRDGWLLGYFGGDKLYVTHDGCNTWQEVSLSPPQIGSAIYRRFQGIPVFQDQQKGYLAVHYSGPSGTPSKLIVYSTANTGKTWQPIKVLNEAREAAGAIFAVVDSAMIVSTGSSARNVSVASIPLNGGSSDVSASDRGVIALTFADTTNGWVWSAEGGLLATHDGGSTWKHIGPSHTPALPSTTVPIHKGLAANVTQSDLLSSSAETLAASGSSSTHISKHLGFDMSYVRSVSDMATWWKYSPYYDTSVYLPGSPNRGAADSTLSSAWVTQVTSQGWGLIPIWVGLQASCTIGITYSQVIDPATAGSQGKSEADSAANAASNLGLSKTVIYKDIENYDTSNSQCASSVTAYLGGWVSELHSLGYSAGVYANPDPAEQNISNASPVPDEIWVAKFDSKATIWHLGALEDIFWSTNQRMHQYLNYNNDSSPSGETYGGVSFSCPSWCIDRDINDASAAGTNGVKTYSSWTVTLVDYPDSPPNTTILGINGGYMHQLDNNNNPISPILTGEYCVQCNANSTSVGFYWQSGTFTSINDYVNGRARPIGVNNIHQIVGYYYPYPGVGGPAPGFLLNTSSGTVSLLNAPNAAPDYTENTTAPSGINDASQIAGSWLDASNITHGFLYDNGTWTSFDHSGTKNTTIVGINGIGQIAGSYVGSKGSYHGFVYSKVDGWTNIDCAGQSSTSLTGINNNGQVVGICGPSAFMYDLANGSMVQISGLPAYSQPWGVSDSNVAAGICEGAPCTPGGLVDGFYATPNP